ncbi:MAG: 30S ribosomal protein S12 methylthiotransferase RimO [Candidatus Aminicenantales bacterium]
MNKVAVINYGCAKNLVDSEVMCGILAEAGYLPVNSPEEADVIVVNTCGFIKPAREESYEALKKVLRLKKKAKKKIIAAGCYVERWKDFLAHEFPQVDAWLGVGDLDKIVKVIEGSSYRQSKQCFLYDHKSPRLLSTPPSWTYVKISEGCSHQCSFCTIPLIKGPYRSRPVSSIIKEVEQLGAKGIKEINIISQDTTYFGCERNEKEGLVNLLRNILNIREIEWIRILYGFPEEISDALLEIMQEEKICSYLDIPFQHSEEKILKKMGRAMNGRKALKLLEKIRKKIPDVAIRTSLIVGFPGEEEKEFEGLRKFCLEARFTHLGVFTYSREKETQAFSLGDPVDKDEKIKRQQEILEIQADISRQNNRKFLKKKLPVLIEGTLKQDSNLLVGRSQYLAPEVDGCVFIPCGKDLASVVNRIQKVEIVETDIYDLWGKLSA